MDLRQLRYFVAIAERGGFAAAASAPRCAVRAQPSRQALEHELGGALLERGARGVAVTESGKVLLARDAGCSAPSMTSRPKCERKPRAQRDGPVGAPSSLADIFYAPLAQLIVKRFPRVRLELSEGLTEEMSDRLLRSESISPSSPPAAERPPRLRDAGGRAGVLDRSAARPPAETRLADPQGIQSTAGRYACRSAAIFPSNVPFSLRVESTMPIKRMVASGLGYGFSPLLRYSSRGRAGHLVCRAACPGCAPTARWP